MVHLLKTILLDPVIEDALIINAAVDLSEKFVEAEKLDNYFIEILTEFFDCPPSYLDEQGDDDEEEIFCQRSRVDNNTAVAEDMVLIEQVEKQVHAMTIMSPKSPNQLDGERERSHAEINGADPLPGPFVFVEPHTPNQTKSQANDVDLGTISSIPIPKPKDKPLPFQATSTPIKRKQIKVRDKVAELKSIVSVWFFGFCLIYSDIYSPVEK